MWHAYLYFTQFSSLFSFEHQQCYQWCFVMSILHHTLLLWWRYYAWSEYQNTLIPHEECWFILLHLFHSWNGVWVSRGWKCSMCLDHKFDRVAIQGSHLSSTEAANSNTYCSIIFTAKAQLTAAHVCNI